MGRQATRGKHTITWEQFKAFTAASRRDLSHAFRVFRGQRTSEKLAQEFEAHFGFPMEKAELAGRRKAAA